MKTFQIFLFLLRNLTVNKCVKVSRVVLILLGGLCSMQTGLELNRYLVYSKTEHAFNG